VTAHDRVEFQWRARSRAPLISHRRGVNGIVLRTLLLAIALHLTAGAAGGAQGVRRAAPRASDPAVRTPAYTADTQSAPAPRAGVRVCAGGDVTLGTNLDTSWTAHFRKRYHIDAPALPRPSSLLAPLRPLVAGADVVLLNVEGAIGSGPAPRKCGPESTSCFALRSPTRAAAALRQVARRAQVVGNVANNHARDAGAEGLRATKRHLTAAGVRVTGADTLPTIVATRRGDTVAVLGFSPFVGPDARDLEGVRRHVRRAAERYPRVVVTVHLGAEGVAAQRTVDSTELYLGADRGNPVAFAQAAVDGGASLVIGHGPHVLRAMEWRGEALVAHSLGNLVTYGPFAFAEPIARGAVLCATLDEEGRVTDARLRATRQKRPGRVAADTSRRALTLIDSLSQLDFPESGVRVERDGTIVRRPAQPALPERRESSDSSPRGRGVTVAPRRSPLGVAARGRGSGPR
jgi:hypothetical protein